MDFILGYQQMFWVFILVFTLVMEALTAGLVTIWFSAGALAALISSYFGIEPIYQTLIFIIVSGIALFATRPLVKNKLEKNMVKTNADLAVGKQGIVVETINSIEGCGQVKVDGKIWSAKSIDSSVIQKESLVTVERIEGVHLIVK